MANSHFFKLLPEDLGIDMALPREMGRKHTHIRGMNRLNPNAKKTSWEKAPRGDIVLGCRQRTFVEKRPKLCFQGLEACLGKSPPLSFACQGKTGWMKTSHVGEGMSPKVTEKMERNIPFIFPSFSISLHLRLLL